MITCCIEQVTFENPHILLLDEPSNHLDLDAVKALIKVISRNFVSLHQLNALQSVANSFIGADNVLFLSMCSTEIKS